MKELFDKIAEYDAKIEELKAAKKELAKQIADNFVADGDIVECDGKKYAVSLKNGGDISHVVWYGKAEVRVRAYPLRKDGTPARIGSMYLDVTKIQKV